MRTTAGSSGHAGLVGVAGLTTALCVALAAAASRSGPLHLSHGNGLSHEAPTTEQPRRVDLRRPQTSGSGHAEHWLVDVGLGIVVVLTLLTLFGLVRLLRRVRLGEMGWQLRRDPPAPVPAAATVDDVLVARTVEAALAELQTGDSPRAAVIAAYAAMVGALAEAGTPGAAGLTPVRLLARSAGVLQGGDAATLTALFERARFSEHPVTEADRADAQARLSAVRARLSGTVPA